MRVPNLKSKALPDHPEDSLDEWPVDENNKRLMRFKWNKPSDDLDNFTNIKDICKWIKEKGPQMFPLSAACIRDISADDLQKKVIKKFRALVETKKEKAKDNTVSKYQSRRKGVRII